MNNKNFLRNFSIDSKLKFDCKKSLIFNYIVTALFDGDH